MKSGVLDKGDIQKMQGRGASRTGLGSTGLDNNKDGKNVELIIINIFFAHDGSLQS